MLWLEKCDAMCGDVLTELAKIGFKNENTIDHTGSSQKMDDFVFRITASKGQCYCVISHCYETTKVYCSTNFSKEEKEAVEKAIINGLGLTKISNA